MKAIPKPRRVALFITCIIDNFFPDVGDASVELIERAGAAVDFPPDQMCCGQPGYNGGFQSDARAVAERWLDAFGDAECVVTPSGSCAAMVRHEYPVLFKGTPREAEALRLAERTFELSAFLVDVMGMTDPGASLPHPVRAAIHDSCHGLRELGVSSQPRALLAKVGNLSLAELPGHDQCCGFGGLFAIKMSAISGAMLGEKIGAIDGLAGVDVIIAGDASCLMHINGGLSRRGSKRRVVHLAEALTGRIGLQP